MSLELKRSGRRADSGRVDGIDLDLVEGERMEMRESDETPPPGLDRLIERPADRSRPGELDPIFQQWIDILVQPLQFGRPALDGRQLKLARSPGKFFNKDKTHTKLNSLDDWAVCTTALTLDLPWTIKRMSVASLP